MKKLILIFVLIIFLISCRKADAVCVDCLAFYFEKPQPINDSELDHFPNKFRGLYVNSDSIYIRIEKDRILEEYFYKFKVHKLTLDSTKTEYDIVDGKFITKDTKDEFDMIPKGDSIELSQKNVDTLFRFSYNQKAKRINGQLVLSKRDSLLWKVQFLLLENNTIKFKNLYYPNDLKKLDSVTKIKAKELDSLSYLINPTRNEFKKILRIKKLGYDKQYKKL